MNELTVYTTSWCPYCATLKAGLRERGLSYHEIDVDADPRAAELVKSLNNGNRTVPTVVFPDGSHATNPHPDEVRARLSA